MGWDDYYCYYCIQVNRDGIGLDCIHVIGTGSWELGTGGFVVWWKCGCGLGGFVFVFTSTFTSTFTKS